MNCREVCPFVLECQDNIKRLSAEVQERQADATLYEVDATMYQAEIDMVAQFGTTIDPEMVAQQTAARARLISNAGRLITISQRMLDYETSRMNAVLERCDDKGPRRKLGFFTIKKTCGGL